MHSSLAIFFSLLCIIPGVILVREPPSSSCYVEMARESQVSSERLPAEPSAFSTLKPPSDPEGDALRSKWTHRPGIP